MLMIPRASKKGEESWTGINYLSISKRPWSRVLVQGVKRDTDCF